ncbi:alpha/beta hydrolase [Raineyella sp. LH-20]|uniref:alpha/beta hydrolase n=1 Tax=Raineyella sp. LH-20 TaxID=3081204 RepID=UPI0029539B5E|nr:alpha/beta fold hydrolase [Raineyella sp. LH-20]WOP17619.1 alpha/beta fold hydrolase [Raineyella sp. LH-20]
MVTRPVRPVVTVDPDAWGYRLHAVDGAHRAGSSSADAPSADTPVPDATVSDATASGATVSSVRPAPGARAVLLCHGFTSTPASLRLWAEGLAARGYDVAVPRLPGHGTTWQEMARTVWTDWYDRVEQEYVRLATDHDVVFVGGLSMGGALAVRLAEQHPEIPAVALVNPSLGTSDPTYVLLPVLSRLIGSIAGIASDIKKPGRREFAYDRTPLAAANSLRALWRDVTVHLDRLTAPTLLFRSTVDHVVDDTSLGVLRTAPCDLTVRMLEDSYHVATLDNDAPQIRTGTAAFFDRFVARR